MTCMRVFWMTKDKEECCLAKLTAQWWQALPAPGSCRNSLPGANMLLFWWHWQSVDSPKWRLLEQFSMSLPLDPALLWAGIWHFRRYEKKKSNVEMKWAILNAPWDFVRWLFHEVSSCCSPGEEEAAQPADLWPPLVSQDGHAVTHVLALMWVLSRQECCRRFWLNRVVQSSQGLFKHSFGEKRCAMITHWTLKKRIPVWKRGTRRPAEPSNFYRETTSLCPLHAQSWFNASLHTVTQSVNNSLK